ncbi:hypothetical protein CDV36_006894 [Fusarium kuroshium]|uniref:Uncharacterized protein n=2 Tax=Fusarium solani species complex TaxID=232080 RepID=A0A3M2S798_9HYPO|nr:hypothetical protein CDV36_006894 [Fusarium kuroshium]RSM01306.1 hypothetical protein CEP52_008572 [Fusarium oligoseptatum]
MNVGGVNSIKRPRFQPANDDFSPLAQVQSSHYQRRKVQDGSAIPHFESGDMRNFIIRKLDAPKEILE